MWSCISSLKKKKNWFPDPSFVNNAKVYETNIVLIYMLQSPKINGQEQTIPAQQPIT